MASTVEALPSMSLRYIVNLIPHSACRFDCIFIYAKVVIFTLFVYKQAYVKSTQSIFTKFDGKVAHGPKENLLDFGGIWIRMQEFLKRN